MSALPGFYAPLILAGGDAVITRTFTASAASATDLTTYNEAAFQGLSIGAVTGGRKVVAVFVARSATASGTLSSCTIGGVAATCTTLSFSNNSAVAIAVADLETGTTADVFPTWSVGMARCAVAVYAMFGASSGTPTATGGDTTDAFTYSLTCGAGSVVFGGATDAGTTSFTSTNLTEDVDSTTNYDSQTYSMASAEFATAQSGTTLTMDVAAPISGAGGFAVFSP